MSKNLTSLKKTTCSNNQSSSELLGIGLSTSDEISSATDLQNKFHKALKVRGVEVDISEFYWKHNTILSSFIDIIYKLLELQDPNQIKIRRIKLTKSSKTDNKHILYYLTLEITDLKYWKFILRTPQVVNHMENVTIDKENYIVTINNLIKFHISLLQKLASGIQQNNPLLLESTSQTTLTTSTTRPTKDRLILDFQSKLINDEISQYNGVKLKINSYNALNITDKPSMFIKRLYELLQLQNPNQVKIEEIILEKTSEKIPNIHVYKLILKVKDPEYWTLFTQTKSVKNNNDVEIDVKNQTITKKTDIYKLAKTLEILTSLIKDDSYKTLPVKKQIAPIVVSEGFPNNTSDNKKRKNSLATEPEQQTTIHSIFNTSYNSYLDTTKLFQEYVKQQRQGYNDQSKNLPPL